MRARILTILIAAAAASALAPGVAGAADLPRVDFTNATDDKVDLQVWRDGWQRVDVVAPGETVKGITNRAWSLNLWIGGCGQLRVQDQVASWPEAFIVRRPGSRSGRIRLSVGESVAPRLDGLWLEVQRRPNDGDFLEFDAKLRDCDTDDRPIRPDRPYTG